MPSLFGRGSSTRKEKHTHHHHHQVPTPPSKSFSVPSRDRDVAGRISRSQAQGLTVQTGRRDMGEFGALPNTSNALSVSLGDTHLSTPPHSPLSPSSPRPFLGPKHHFAPTNIPSVTTSNSIDSFVYATDEVTGQRSYGILGGVGMNVTLNLEDVGGVIKDVGKELGRRGLTTPMLFSNQALELNSTRTKCLIQAYLDLIRSGTHKTRHLNWTQDLRLAKEYELAWLLRWALSRVVRVREGTREISHGLLQWEIYEEWRGRERAANYPYDAFPYLSALVTSDVYHLVLTPLLSLLSRFAAHSHLSGLTPHTLSSLFAPLLFDIPTSTPCMIAHTSFVRAACATEHLLLSYIRASSQGDVLGFTDLPSRLKEWVSGYPSMVASDADLARAAPRQGARTIRCERASRIVRAYSKDLISNAELWATDISPTTTWDAWDRVLLKNRRGEAGRPKFSNQWRRRMAVKEVLPLPTSLSMPSMAGQPMEYGRAKAPHQVGKDTPSRRGEDEEEARWGSLAGKEWGLFEEGGFDSTELGKEKDGEMRSRLQFDLTESAKLSVSDRRQTMDWTEFASDQGGFNRTDPILDVSLTFSTPLATSISDWPRERAELHRRLHKSQKEATPFHYDTTPRVETEISHDFGGRTDQQGRLFVEEAFLDCWADWMMGAGWTDREELTFKEANWALIEYKARPRIEEGMTEGLGDPRTTDLCFIFEERVPMDYQLAVADPKQKKTFATLFSTTRKKRDGTGRRSSIARVASGWDDSDFDRMLLHRERTKKITLSKTGHQSTTTVFHSHSADQRSQKSPVKANTLQPSPGAVTMRRGSKSSDKTEVPEDPKLSDGMANFFSKNKERVVRRAKTDENTKSKWRGGVGGGGQKEREVDFDVRSASGVSSDGSPRDLQVGHKEKPEEEKWMDILVAHGARRMDRQDAALPPPPQGSRMRLNVNGAVGGLPVSPIPPLLRKPSPQPPVEIDPYADLDDRDALDPLATPGFSGAGAASGHDRSPETSGSTDPHEAITPQVSADLTRWPSTGKRKPVPAIPESTPSPSHDDDALNEDAPPIPPVKDSSVSLPTVLSPLPQRDSTKVKNLVDVFNRNSQILSPSPKRDTVHSVVDAYNRDSMISTTSSDFEPTSELAYDKGSDEGERGKLGDGGITSGAVLAGGGEEEGVDKLAPPGPIFDLTPGREPSPARYRHGEPLQFVGEEEEEE